MRADLKKTGDVDSGILTSMALERKEGLIVTADTNQNVRVIDLKQNLLLQVKFGNRVGAVGFVDNKGDLMIGHGNTLTVVSKDHYLSIEPKSQKSKFDKKAKPCARFKEILSKK